MTRRLAAFALCLFGMGALDHGLQAFWNVIGQGYGPGMSIDTFAADAVAKRRFVAIGEGIGVTGLFLAALRIGFPAGLIGDQARWIVALALALAAGRSFLGLGEGFTAPFGLLMVICASLALVIYRYLPQRGA